MLVRDLKKLLDGMPENATFVKHGKDHDYVAVGVRQETAVVGADGSLNEDWGVAGQKVPVVVLH